MAPSQKRLELQTLLEGVLGKPDVYFQPPSNVQMNYDCIVYALDDVKTEFADNTPYSFAKRYRLTYITRDPDSLIPDAIVKLPMCSFDRPYTADNLHHYVFNLYF
jgi:hypothetical protein